MEKSRHISTADMDKLRKGVQYPDELVGYPEDKEHEEEFINKNDPKHKFVPIDNVPDEDHLNPEDEILNRLEQKKRRESLRTAKKFLKLIETIKPNIKDKELLKRYPKSSDRINPQGRWEASEEEIANINRYILKLGLNSRFHLKSPNLIKEISQMSPQDLEEFEQALTRFIESNSSDNN